MSALRLGAFALLALSGCDADFRFALDAGAPDAGVSADGGCGCAAPFPLCRDDGTCVECRGDADCPGQLCDVTTGRCAVSCNQAADTCDPTMYRRGCSDDVGAARCTDCKEPEDCTGASPVCAARRGVCVQCATNLHCAGATPRCDVVLGQCVP
ncbi:MAG: hypothetical protein Q8N23_27480 [Archangium sp.]|nr:hypothetical protein [Archangium sp.]MDP3156449.1 hypothetical protein [Archangium sp.]MDP3573105.1 hypothetical protein [Archangium sp.]